MPKVGLKNYWNKRAKELGNFTDAPSTRYYLKSEVALIRKTIWPLRKKKLLKLDLWNEVVNTKILFWAAAMGAKIYGIDISDYLVKKARQDFKKINIPVHLRVSDIRKIKFKSNFFDYLYSMGTIEHIPDYEKAIREIYRVLKPGGKCIIGVPNKLDPFLRPLMVSLLSTINMYPYAPEKSFTINELKNLLERNDFVVTHETGILFMPGWLRIVDIFFYQRLKFLTFFTNLALKPFEFLERRFDFIKRNGYLIVCVAKKPK